MSENKFEPNGVLIVNKPAGITSHDVVGKIRKLYGTRKVGHTGTLDPLATGVLVVLLGRAAKAAEYLVADTKTYRARLTLGITTDTEDITGKILTESGEIPSAEAVVGACEKFIGKIQQIPPMYSALKVDGKKLYDLAREGIEVERKARDIEIFRLECTNTDKANEYDLLVKCSSGTYIRTLCADIGATLGCGGVMSALHRVQAGGFEIENSHTLEELEALEMSERNNLLAPTESLFEELSAVKLPAFYEKLCRSGCEIYQNKIKTSFEVGTRVRLHTQSGEFFALGEVREYENGTAIKAIKTFSL
ncbi:MAG: tRNA pseudouridine(55) synthase TruB [Clostridia bacterium]|nr:tRNA pseudouridine(55) synthase TruB [Clostridia bacterium]